MILTIVGVFIYIFYLWLFDYLDETKSNYYGHFIICSYLLFLIGGICLIIYELLNVLGIIDYFYSSNTLT